MFRNFYISVPNEVLEAAKIDGTGFFGIYRTIMVPLSLTGFVVVGIWQFTNIWNEFLFAVTLTTQNQQPIMVALQDLLKANQLTSFSENFLRILSKPQ